MKIRLIVFMFSAFLLPSLFAQDPFSDPVKIYMNDSLPFILDTISSPDEANTYKDKSSWEMPVFRRSDLHMYIYKDSASVFGSLENLRVKDSLGILFVSEICYKARADAKKHYKMYKAPAAGTLFLSVLTPIAGLAIAIPSSQTPPRFENLGIPDVDILQERIYYEAYTKEARRIKAKKTWTNFGIGFAIHFGIIFGLMSIL